MSKRERDEEPFLILIGLAEEESNQLFIYHTPYDPEVWTDEIISQLHQSLPSDRIRTKVPGFEVDGYFPDEKMWVYFPHEKLAELGKVRQIARVVIAYVYE